MKKQNKQRILISWVGQTDLNASQGKIDGLGPVAQAATQREFEHIILLCNYPKQKAKLFTSWLKKNTETPIDLHIPTLSGPTNFGEIYTAVTKVVDTIKKSHGDSLKLTFHLSPGTPAMSAVWIILAKTRYAAELIESSKEHGVKTANVPFDISAEFIPDLMKQADQRITQLSSDNYVIDAAFVSVIHQSESMKRVLQKAQKIAPRSLPVLIEGESGTGKEVLARSIHEASLRKDKPFIAVNCGAINKELAESEFFGHKKGSFTGAGADRKGYFESANQGTLFLDEIGELPLELQVKLLRALQEQEVTPVGASKPIKIDTRIIAATNRNLIQEVEAGNFREDLFYRIAVAVIRLPALRERQGDLNLLTDYFLKRINSGSTTEPNYKHKKLSASARNLMLQHRWPGNIRELSNTLMRATIWSEDETINKKDIKEAILESPNSIQKNDSILNQDLSSGIDLQGLIDNVATHYLERALQETHGNKSKATELLGLTNYQTLNNWLKKYDVS
jgi:transcriptional regulator with PAS, ATPase and Fis domain